MNKYQEALNYAISITVGFAIFILLCGLLLLDVFIFTLGHYILTIILMLVEIFVISFIAHLAELN